MNNRGFTILEVMIAVAILGMSLTAIFSSEVGAVHIANRARHQNVASILARCKMGEIEELVSIEGLPLVEKTGEDACCEHAEVDGYQCEWIIERIILPDFGLDEEGAFDDEEEESATDTALDIVTSEADSAEDFISGQASGGLTSMAMQLGLPIIKPSIEEQVRRVTVNIRWQEGSEERGFDLIQFLVAEQPAQVEETEETVDEDEEAS